MYTSFLFLHSWLRWIVLLLLVLAVGRALWGWLGSRPWKDMDRNLSRFAVIAIDLQLLFGLVLYLFLSPLTRAAFRDFGPAMGDSVLRFWAVEHGVLMLAVVVLGHVGKVKAQRAGRAGESRRAHRLAAVLFGIALLLALAGSPWPGMEAGRPLFRLGA